MERSNGGRPSKNSGQPGPSFTARLEELEIPEVSAKRWQNIAKMPEERFEEFIAETRESGGEITTAAALRVAHGQSVHFSSSSDGWSTPQDLFDELDAEFHFNVDVCANENNAKCELYFDQSEAGQTKEWGGSCWMNPPYGDEILCVQGWAKHQITLLDCGVRGEVVMSEERVRRLDRENVVPIRSRL